MLFQTSLALPPSDMSTSGRPFTALTKAGLSWATALACICRGCAAYVVSSACLEVQQTMQPTLLKRNQPCSPPPTQYQKYWDVCSGPLLPPTCCCNMCLCGQTHVLAKAVPTESLIQLASTFTCLPTYVSSFSCFDTVSLDGLSASTSSTYAGEKTELSLHGPGQRLHHADAAPAVHSGTQGAQKNLGPASSSRRPADEPVNSLQSRPCELRPNCTLCQHLSVIGDGLLSRRTHGSEQKCLVYSSMLDKSLVANRKYPRCNCLLPVPGQIALIRF